MAEVRRRELVLASESPSRRHLLEAAGLCFEAVPAQIDEAAMRERLAGMAPPAVAEGLARAKAEAVSARLADALVIGADQVLALGDRLISKPRDLAEAREQLELLRGKTHSLHTAAVLALAGETVWSLTEAASLVMRTFSNASLEGYLAEVGERICHTVGAYEIEGRGVQLFERVVGDHFTIIGLPLLPLLAELRARGAIET